MVKGFDQKIKMINEMDSVAKQRITRINQVIDEHSLQKFSEIVKS